MIVTEDVVEVVGTETKGVKCDQCGLEYQPEAIGLVNWLTLIIGHRRRDGGQNPANDRDFCSRTCLARFLSENVMITTHPYGWERVP